VGKAGELHQEQWWQWWRQECKLPSCRTGGSDETGAAEPDAQVQNVCQEARGVQGVRWGHQKQGIGVTWGSMN